MTPLARAALVTALLGCAPQVVNAVGDGPGESGAGPSPAGRANMGGTAGVGAGASGGLPAGGTSGTRALVHRYAFDGTGVVATDSVGARDGVVVNTELGGDGSVVLAGGVSNQYIDLPRFIVSRLRSATFEAWITWDGGSAPWQRVFDFGEDEDLGYELGPDDLPMRGRRYVFLTARTPPTALSPEGVLRLGYQKVPRLEGQFDAPGPLPSGELTQVAVAIDEARQVVSLFVNGAIAGGEQPFTDTLGEIYDINNWLGRSNFDDASFGGTFHEFRIYSFALDEAQIAANFQRGADEPAVQ